MEMAVITTPKATVTVSCNPQAGAGSHEVAMAMKQSPTKNPANGVRNPIVSVDPLAIKTRPNIALAKLRLDGPEK